MKPIILIILLIFPAVLPAQSGNAGVEADQELGQIDGAPSWRQAMGGAVLGLPTVQAQSAVVVLDGGSIKAYSASGKPLWNYYARGKLSPFVTRSREGTSYISRINGNFIAINRIGRELWRLNPGGPLSGTVVLGWDGRLFIPTSDTISCYTAAGTLLWKRKFDKLITLSPRLDQDGGILLALESGETLRIDPFGRTAVWRLQAPPQELVSLKAGDKKAALRIMAIRADGGLELLDCANPAAAPISLPALPAPSLAAVSRGNRAAITLTNGQVVLVSGDNGTVLWTGDSHIREQGGNGGHGAAMIYDERGIYTLSSNGATAFTGEGRQLWFTTLKNASGIPAFDDNGVLYSGGLDWILYARKIEDRPLNSPQSLYGPAPAGTYGTGRPPPSPGANGSELFDETETQKRLEAILRGIQSGAVGENELAWTAYLMELIAAGYNRPAASLSHPPAQLAQRVQALRLLSRIGSFETIPFLARVFKRETDPALKAAAAEAIGAIGLDDKGIAINTFLNAIDTGNPISDTQVLVAVAAATGSLCRFSGPPLSADGIRILTLLSAANQPRLVRQQARREIDSLRQ